MQASKPKILITGDDGLQSHFLLELALACSSFFEVRISATKDKMSWSSKSITRYEDILVEKKDLNSFKSLEVQGRPADAVQIGLKHWKDTDIVASGINIGHNAGLPFIFSSGTIAAALEAKLLGYPSLAFSMRLPAREFEAASQHWGELNPTRLAHLKASAQHAALYCQSWLEKKDKTHILNINFPENCTSETKSQRTHADPFPYPFLFQEDQPGKYQFKLKTGPLVYQKGSDLDTLDQGLISETYLNFSTISMA